MKMSAKPIILICLTRMIFIVLPHCRVLYLVSEVICEKRSQLSLVISYMTDPVCHCHHHNVTRLLIGLFASSPGRLLLYFNVGNSLSGIGL